jgi:hypothetical protein
MIADECDDDVATGARLAKGDWAQIASIVDEELAGENHTLVEYQRGSASAARTRR